jgi:hypothetical protein
VTVEMQSCAMNKIQESRVETNSELVFSTQKLDFCNDKIFKSKQLNISIHLYNLCLPAVSVLCSKALMDPMSRKY